MKKYILKLAFLTIFISSLNSQNKTTITNNQNDSILGDQNEKPIIELVFCLDATGSMNGLIHTAKEKIWDIVTMTSQSNPSPDIRLGMIFYRDLQDDFITKTYPLTSNIDSIYSELLLIQAQGGGDSPESVNQALNEAVIKMGWKEGKNIYRTIFLVGDCPPHMDYLQDVKYPVSCKMANEKGITINTIKLGIQCSEAIPHFKAIAEATNGEYKQLGQNADDVVIETPFDDSIKHYSNKIDASKLYYGSHKEKMEMNENKDKSMYLYDKSSANAVASRAKFNLSSAGKKNLYGNKELLDDLMTEKVKLDSIQENELPDEIKKMNEKERTEYIKQLQKERTSNITKLTELTKKRDQYISQNTKKDSTKTMFSNEIFKVVKDQATRKGVKIEDYK